MPLEKPSAVSIALVILASILVIFFFARQLTGASLEGFAAKPSQLAHEVYQSSRALFDKTKGAATYSEYKTTLERGADPVVYTDVRRLWKEGRLSPESVQSVL
jgi:hypothetical protein